jgi:hypothetical protein
MNSQRKGSQLTNVLVAIVVVVVVVVGITYCTSGVQERNGAEKVGLARYPGLDTADTKKYVNSLTFDPNHPHQYIVDTLVDGVHLRITPEKKAYQAPWKAALSAGPGYIVALIENKDAVTYSDLDLAANDSAYVWVGEIAGGARRVAYYRINRVNGTAVFLKRAISAGWCSLGESHGDTSAVHLHTTPQCQGGNHSFYAYAGETDELATRHLNASPYRLASNTNGSNVMVATLLHTEGLWISCSSGCCEASGTSLY